MLRALYPILVCAPLLGACVGTTCNDHLTIELDPPLTSGAGYRLEITTDGDTVVCETADADPCAFFSTTEDSFDSIYVPGNPTVVDVTVFRDGKVVAEAELTPVYSDEPTEPGAVRVEGCDTARESIVTR